MAEVPSVLKAHDLVRFLDKAAELKEHKPVASYWCYYFVVQKIIQDGLHTQSPECEQYAGQLMDILEKLRLQLKDQEEVTDETEAARYIEEFAGAVLDRANLQIQSNTVTPRTVHALRAAYSFYDLLSIWNAVTPEIAQKIKYSKYHAVRILKALQAGQDPNLTNPTPPRQGSQSPAELAAGEVGDDPQDDPGRSPAPARRLYQPFVEDDDGAELSQAPGSPPAPPRPPKVVDEPVRLPPGRGPLQMSDQPESIDSASQGLPSPSFYSGPTISSPHSRMDSQVSTRGRAPPAFTSSPIPQPPLEPFAHLNRQPQTTPSSVGLSHRRPDYHPSYGSSSGRGVREESPGYGGSDNEPDPEVISQAQKHAKWAVSALDFSDTATAIKELNNALRLIQGL